MVLSVCRATFDIWSVAAAEEGSLFFGWDNVVGDEEIAGSGVGLLVETIGADVGAGLEALFNGRFCKAAAVPSRITPFFAAKALFMAVSESMNPKKRGVMKSA